MEQTTSLRTKMYDSSLKWTIENFLDYGACNISSITSETINIDHTDAQWSLTIYPTMKKSLGFDNFSQKILNFVLKISDNELNSKAKRLFKADIKVEPFGHMLMSPANRHLVKSKGFFAEPTMNEPVVKVFEYSEVEEGARLDGSLVFNEDKFASYLDAGALTIYANVSLKTVEVCNVLKKP